MLRARGLGGTEWDADAFPAASLADAAAGSLAARGLTFAIAHAAPRRWLPLKGPTGGAAQRGAVANAARLAQHAWAAGPAAKLLCGNVVVHLSSGSLIVPQEMPSQDRILYYCMYLNCTIRKS